MTNVEIRKNDQNPNLKSSVRAAASHSGYDIRNSFGLRHSAFRFQIGKPPWCCPRQAEFWRLCCTGWCAAYFNLRTKNEERRMKACNELMVYSAEQRNSHWLPLSSANSFPRMKPAEYLAANSYDRELRLGRTTGQHTEQSPKRTLYPKWAPCWRRPTSPAIGLNS